MVLINLSFEFLGHNHYYSYQYNYKLSKIRKHILFCFPSHLLTHKNMLRHFAALANHFNIRIISNLIQTGFEFLTRCCMSLGFHKLGIRQENYQSHSRLDLSEATWFSVQLTPFFSLQLKLISPIQNPNAQRDLTIANQS